MLNSNLTERIKGIGKNVSMGAAHGLWVGFVGVIILMAATDGRGESHVPTVFLSTLAGGIAVAAMFSLFNTAAGSNKGERLDDDLGEAPEEMEPVNIENKLELLSRMQSDRNDGE